MVTCVCVHYGEKSETPAEGVLSETCIDIKLKSNSKLQVKVHLLFMMFVLVT